MYVLDSYTPKTVFESFHKTTLSYLNSWLKNYKKPLIIAGPIGVGKSTLVRLFAKEQDLTVYELNPSDERDKDSILKTLQAVSQSRSIFTKKNLLFFDDIDVFISDDRGGFETILKIAKESINPVIFVVTNLYADKKLAKLRDMCEIIKINSVRPSTLLNYLSEMCIKKKIKFDRVALEELIKTNSGDLRATFLDFDFLAPFGITKESLNLLSGRERKKDVFKTVLGLFKSKSYLESQKVANATEIDYDLLFAWIVENLHLFYEKDNLKEAYSLVSLADLNKSRIYLRQNWVFFRYFIAFGIIAPCIVPKKDHFTFRIAYPQSIKLRSKEFSKYSKNKKAAQILSKVFRGSKRKIVSEIFFLKFFVKDGGFISYLKENLNDDDLNVLQDFFKVKFIDNKVNASAKTEITKSNDKKNIVVPHKPLDLKANENEKMKEKKKELNQDNPKTRQRKLF